MDQILICIALDGQGFLLMNPSLPFALLTISLMCGFQERLLDMTISRCVATGTVPSVSSCILYRSYLWVILIW